MAVETTAAVSGVSNSELDAAIFPVWLFAVQVGEVEELVIFISLIPCMVVTTYKDSSIEANNPTVPIMSINKRVIVFFIVYLSF